MPWRAEPGTVAPPYHVLVSETMLQQTQIATVVAYFHRFMQALPTLGDLAAADEQQVLRLWQGLGYYRRARHLHAAAKTIVADHAGSIPPTAAALATLPGVGRYTAGAVASMAFAECTPLVDGNVARVLSRVLNLHDPIDTTPGKKRLWAEADALVQSAVAARMRHRRRNFKAGDWNQALMELGATICTPRQPACEGCPVRAHCQAHARGLTAELPVISKRTKQRPVVHHIFALEYNGKLLFQQNGETGLWANMWQMPTVETLPPAPPTAAQKPPDLKSLAASLAVKTGRPTHLNSFVHLTTHKRIRCEFWRVRCTASPTAAASDDAAPPFTWRHPEDVDDLPLPQPQLRALALLPTGTPPLAR